MALSGDRATVGRSSNDCQRQFGDWQRRSGTDSAHPANVSGTPASVSSRLDAVIVGLATDSARLATVSAHLATLRRDPEIASLHFGDNRGGNAALAGLPPLESSGLVTPMAARLSTCAEICSATPLVV